VNAPDLGTGGVGSPLVWLIFSVVIVTALALDLGVFHRSARVVRMKEAAIWTGVWCTLGLLFNGFVYHRLGTESALQFLQGWLLELALSVDNVFVFILIFRFFKVKDAHQHRVLFWGIIGALVARGVFIAAGAALIQRFHWVMYVLGAFLILTAFKMLFQRDEELDPSKNVVLRLFRRLVPSTPDYHEEKFVVRVDGALRATPLLAVLVVIDAVDVMFAVDSIPAVFGVTTDVFIVFTSNIFAVLGLRSLFFLVSGLVRKLHYLSYGVAIILAFIGVKIFIEGFYKIPVGVSLGVLAGVLLISSAASLLVPHRE
jgi:tellurite resistance protein TerC